MKYMMSIHQSYADLSRADEIHVDYKDKERLYDLIEEKIFKPTIYLYIPKEQEIEYQQLNTFKEVFTLILAVEDAFLIPSLKEKGFNVFWSYPVASYWELQGLLDLGVCEVLLDAPLYFDLPTVKKECGKVEIRLIANRCINSYMPRKNGICGTYIRPEDVEKYSQYVDHLEFNTDTLSKELTLIDIYKNKHFWPGNLNLLLSYLNENIDNRGLNDENFAERRIKCKQICQINNRCHFCPTLFKLINTVDQNKEYIKKTYGIEN